MKKFNMFVLVLGMSIGQSAFAQGVGINATGASPDNSAMLDVAGDSSGILIPRVDLSTPSLFKAPGPAPHLMVVNTNNLYAGSTNPYNNGIGLYMNFGTKVLPKWKRFLTSDDAATFWTTTGNAGTNPLNNWIGTTDDVNFVIRAGSGVIASKRKITIPFAGLGDMIFENIRALQLPQGTATNPSLRFGTATSAGISASTNLGYDIAIQYGGALTSYLFHTTGMTIDNVGGYPAPPQANTKLDVNGSIYTRDQIVYSRGHNSGVGGEETNQDRTAEINRYWSGSFTTAGNSVPIFTEYNLLQFRIVRTGTTYTIESRRYGGASKGYVSNGTVHTLPSGTWGSWVAITSPMAGGTGNKYEYIVTANQATGGNNLDPMYTITIFFNGNSGSTDYIRVLINAFYYH
jgi:hypothetical protein